jgi:hypothetical protein
MRLLIPFLAIIAVFLAFAFELFQSYRRTGFVPPALARLSRAFGGAYYTALLGIGMTNLGTTFTHSLSITPTLLIARPIIHQAVVTNTAPVLVCTIGTNIITVATGVGTLVTCDLEVQQVHSIVGGP